MEKVYIRVDGSVHVGLGHLVRCIALAQMLAKDFSVHFVCKEIPEQTKDELKKAGFELHIINDEEHFLQLLSGQDIAVLDGYGFDIAYQQKIKSTGASVVCIDDMHDKPFAADLIINHAPGISPQDYATAPDTSFALGTDYALLRPAFLAHAKNKITADKTESVLICFGGADGKNLTAIALEAAIAFNQFKKINIVTGPAYSFAESLQPIVLSNKTVEHYHAVNEHKMLELMIGSDVAIVPASGILYEALCAGCKIISGTYVDNQQFIYQAFKSASAFISAGNFSSNEITTALNKLGTTAASKVSLVDGLSPKRMATAFYDLKLAVRDATAADCRLLFGWANDTAVRSNAIHKKQIEWADHTKWFASKLVDNHSKLFILTYNGVPAGQVRYDYTGTAWIIDYSIDKKYRGKGFGKSLIEKTLRHFTGSEVQAMVLETNTASAATFEKLHFKPAGNETINGQNFLVYKLFL